MQGRHEGHSHFSFCFFVQTSQKYKMAETTNKRKSGNLNVKQKINAAEYEERFCFATMSFVETKAKKKQVVDAGTD